MATALRPGQQVDVQVGRIRRVWLGTEIVRVVIAVIHLLESRPGARIACRRRKTRAQARPPLLLVPVVEPARVESAERVPADTLIVFEDQAEFRFERQVGANVDAAERVGIVAIEGLAVPPVIAGLQAHVIRARLVARPCGTDDARAAQLALPSTPVRTMLPRRLWHLAVAPQCVVRGIQRVRQSGCGVGRIADPDPLVHEEHLIRPGRQGSVSR